MTVVEADVVVIGVGSVGSMASWQLATRGLRVIGIDRFPIPGPFSAYAGESRVFRLLGCLPGMDGVVVATGFSGHGFKMAPSLGAVAADLISEGTTTTAVGFMDPARFLPPRQTVTALPLDGTASSPEPS